jgi:hypothetical protein
VIEQAGHPVVVINIFFPPWAVGTLAAVARLLLRLKTAPAHRLMLVESEGVGRKRKCKKEASAK